MKPIVICHGDALENLMNELELIVEKYNEVSMTRPTMIRFAFDEIDGGIKIKINNFSWSRAHGKRLYEEES